MEDEWIWIASDSRPYDYSVTLYIDPKTELVKKVRCEFSHFNYHDEEVWNEYETIISVEQALAWVYPNEYAISVILENTKNDYAQVLERLKTQQGTQDGR